MGKLAVASMRALSESGMYGDGGTLYLRVAPGGSKSWIQRLVVGVGVESGQFMLQERGPVFEFGTHCR